MIRAGGSVHIIEPLIPVNPKSQMKRWVFANDRGRFPRTELQMRGLVERVAPIAVSELAVGSLHDALFEAGQIVSYGNKRLPDKSRGVSCGCTAFVTYLE